MKRAIFRVIEHTFAVAVIGVFVGEILNALPASLIGIGRAYPGLHATHRAYLCTFCAAAIACLLIGAILHGHITGRIYRWSTARFMAVTSAAAMLAAVAALLAYSPKLTSDFRVYHETATWLSEMSPARIALNHRDLLHNERFRGMLGFFGGWTEYPVSGFLARVLFYIYPLYRIVGPHLVATQILNAVLHVLTAVNLFFICRWTLKDARIGRLAVVFYLIVPVNYVMLNLPNHDIAGRFYLSLAFLAITWLHRRATRGASIAADVLVSFALGGLLSVCEAQRSIGTFLFVSLAVYAVFVLIARLARPREGLTRTAALRLVLLVSVLPLAVYSLSARPIRFEVRDSRTLHMTIFAGSNAAHGTNYRALFEHRYSYMTKLDPADERWSYAVARLGGEIYRNLRSYLAVLSQRAAHLFDVGRSQHYVTAQCADGRCLFPPELTLDLSRIVRLFLFACAVLGFGFFLSDFRAENALTATVLFGSLFGAAVTLGHCAPRHSLLLHMHFAVFAAGGLVSATTWLQRLRAPFGRSLGNAVVDTACRYAAVPVHVIVLLSVAVACVLVFRAIWPRLGYDFLDLRTAHIVCTPAGRLLSSTAVAPLRPQERPFKFAFRMPGNVHEKFSCEARWTTAVEPRRPFRVRLFLRVHRNADPATHIAIDANGRSVVDSRVEDISLAPLKWHPEFALTFLRSPLLTAPDGRLNLAFRVSAPPTATRIDTPLAVLEFVQVRTVHQPHDGTD